MSTAHRVRIQPYGHRFGNDLKAELESETWTSLDLAVAWVRASGMQHILPALKGFLTAGHALRTTVGIDIQHTSEEGLRALLGLSGEGNAETRVYHNEAKGGRSTFHPKLYLFRNATTARLYMGSNNLTGGGLFTNVEACTVIDAAVSDPGILEVLAMLGAWAGGDGGLVLPLDEALLKKLLRGGYVLPEKKLKAERAAAAATTVGQPKGGQGVFGSRHWTAPPTPPIPTSTPVPKKKTAATLADTRILLMRVRKGSETKRPTQAQIPKSLKETDSFFHGVTEIVSSHDGASREISSASARGIINTYKVEIPEMRDFANPVLKLQRDGAGAVVYEALDGDEDEGAAVLAALEEGLKANPPTTRLTKPANPGSSTWWRFVR